MEDDNKDNKDLNELIIGDKIYKVKSLGGDGKDTLLINFNSYELCSINSLDRVYNDLTENLKGYKIMLIDNGAEDLSIIDSSKLEIIEELETLLNKLKKEVNVEWFKR